MSTRKSLFDYLRRAAGPELGLQVATYAGELKAEVTLREVSIPNGYQGTVNVYDIALLDQFFKDPANKSVVEADDKKYQARLAARKAK